MLANPVVVDVTVSECCRVDRGISAPVTLCAWGLPTA